MVCTGCEDENCAASGLWEEMRSVPRSASALYYRVLESLAGRNSGEDGRRMLAVGRLSI